MLMAQATLLCSHVTGSPGVLKARVILLCCIFPIPCPRVLEGCTWSHRVDMPQMGPTNNSILVQLPEAMQQASAQAPHVAVTWLLGRGRQISSQTPGVAVVAASLLLGGLPLNHPRTGATACMCTLTQTLAGFLQVCLGP